MGDKERALAEAERLRQQILAEERERNKNRAKQEQDKQKGDPR